MYSWASRTSSGWGLGTPRSICAVHTRVPCLWELHSPKSIPPSLGDHKVFQITTVFNTVVHWFIKAIRSTKICQKLEQTEASGSPPLITPLFILLTAVLSEESHWGGIPTTVIFNLWNVVSYTSIYSRLCPGPWEQGPIFPVKRQSGIPMKVVRSHLTSAELLTHF